MVSRQKSISGRCDPPRGGPPWGWGLWVALVWLALGIPAHATVLVSDTFADGERSTQNQPSSMKWYVGGTNASVGSGGLMVSGSGPQATAMAYFNPAELQVGESLKLSFSYSFQQVSNGDNNFMFGLYNSGGSHVAKDGSNFNNSLFSSYTGYAASGVLGSDPSGPGRDHIEVRDKIANNLLSISSYTEGQEYKQSGAATPGEIYMASLQISRTAAGITVEGQIGNTDFVQKYTSGLVTRFDSIGIFATGNPGALTFDRVQLDYTTVPEPSSFLAMALVGVVVVGRMAKPKIVGKLRAKAYEAGFFIKRPKNIL